MRPRPRRRWRSALTTTLACTASLLVWRRFKRPMPGLVERVYDLNPRLALVGPVLPVGTVLRLPVPVTRTEPDVTPVRLWS